MLCFLQTARYYDVLSSTSPHSSVTLSGLVLRLLVAGSYLLCLSFSKLGFTCTVNEWIEVTGIYSGVVIQYERLAKLSAISGVAATC